MNPKPLENKNGVEPIMLFTRYWHTQQQSKKAHAKIDVSVLPTCPCCLKNASFRKRDLVANAKYVNNKLYSF
ncbi:hypothetical protein SAMN04515674_103194 [Pseudarcicella hirudinis]|uniref:Uncharacterized protein n=1 Tax=Pseudarcicella hirudinis TaxID=1079859 RepID=A0A1I5QGX1_9BACT|nr:hypothetical protein SAMN04515674_103194 [Pseudarcicella hirudinis]